MGPDDTQPMIHNIVFDNRIIAIRVNLNAEAVARYKIGGAGNDVMLNHSPGGAVVDEDASTAHIMDGIV
ncbi:hypothetical protein D3C76_1676000 [compost metagenome]